MDIMILCLIAFVAGSVIYTVISYITKYLSKPTSFNIIYLFSSMLSMFLVIFLSPTFLLPGILPYAVGQTEGVIFIVLGCGALGLASNFFVNLPLSFVIKKLHEANISITEGLKPTPKILIYGFALIGLLSLIGGASVYAISQYVASIHSEGKIIAVGVKVYGNSALSVELESIYWGKIANGSSATKQIWVLNTGSQPVTLSLYIDNWNPSVAKDYMSVTWNYIDYVIQPNAVRQIDLTLHVMPNITGITDFEFDINIVAESN